MEDYLTHHGIRGMRWGVRRKRQSNNLNGDRRSKKGNFSNKIRNIFGRKNTSKAKKVHVLLNKPSSHKAQKYNEEEYIRKLRKEIEKLQLERTYRQLMSERHPKKDHKFAKGVQDVLANSAKTVAQKYTTQFMDNAVKNMLNKRARNN